MMRSVILTADTAEATPAVAPELEALLASLRSADQGRIRLLEEENRWLKTKLTFWLTKEQKGPFPVNTESLWLVQEKSGYRVKNAPFFIDDVSFDDLIAVRRLDNGNVTLDKVLEKSGNSTIWLYLKDSQRGEPIVQLLLNAGCGVEGGVIANYYSINVPASVAIQPILKVLEDAVEEGIAIADYPAIRHD